MLVKEVVHDPVHNSKCYLKVILMITPLVIVIIVETNIFQPNWSPPCFLNEAHPSHFCALAQVPFLFSTLLKIVVK